MIELIKIENGVIVMNRDDIASIECFKKLGRRLNPTKGDGDGRKKRLNMLELMYVKYMAEADLDMNIYAGLSTRDKHKKIIGNIGLYNDWKPDNLVKVCIAKYKEIINNYLPTVALLNSLERGLMVSKKVIDSLLNQMESLIEDNNDKLQDIISGNGNSNDIEVIEKLSNSTKLLNDNVNQILKIGKSLPTTLTSVKELRKQVKIQKGKTKELRGGRVKFNREDS